MRHVLGLWLAAASTFAAAGCSDPVPVPCPVGTARASSGACLRGCRPSECANETCEDGLVFVRDENGAGVCVAPGDANLVTDAGPGDVDAGRDADMGAGDACMPTTEVCDGMNDDDCDDSVDEGCECTNGTVEACRVDGALGVCATGSRTCDSGAFGTCIVGTETTETCNLADDDCDGFTDEGPAVCIPNTLRVFAGASTSCAMLPVLRTAACWGSVFMLPVDGPGSQPAPVQIVPLIASRLALGTGMTCGLSTGGQASCHRWRPGEEVRLQEVPRTAPFTSVRDVSANGSFNATGCVVSADDGSLGCFGWMDREGVYTDHGTNPYRMNGPSGAPITGASRVSVSEGYACYVNSARVVNCFTFNPTFANAAGQLGDGSTVPANAGDPARTVVWANSGAPLSGAMELTTSPDFACALLASGRVACWGDNTNGQVGDGEEGVLLGARLVRNERNDPLEGVKQISSNGRATCAVGEEAGTSFVRCWGFSSESEELGVAAPVPTTLRVATPIEATLDVDGIALGRSHACAWPNDETRVFCWGNNSLGQLGVGDTAGGGRMPRTVLLPEP